MKSGYPEGARSSLAALAFLVAACGGSAPRPSSASGAPNAELAPTGALDAQRNTAGWWGPGARGSVYTVYDDYRRLEGDETSLHLRGQTAWVDLTSDAGRASQAGAYARRVTFKVDQAALSEPGVVERIENLCDETREVALDVRGVATGTLEHVHSLPCLRALSVESVDDASLAQLIRFTSLHALRIRDHSLSARGVSRLAALTLLRTLELTLRRGMSDAMGSLCAAAPGLHELTIPDGDPGSLEAASRCPQLRRLMLPFPAESGVEVRHLRYLPRLEVLELVGTDITDADLAHLEQLGALRELSLVGSEALRGDGFASLTQLPLTRIDLAATPVGGAIMQHLGNIPTLEYLDLADATISDQDLSYLASLARLRVLKLGGEGIHDEGLQHLVGLTELRELQLSGTSVRGPGLAWLAPLAHLQVLELVGADLGGRLHHLPPLPELHALGLGSTGANDEDLVSLSSVSQLERLSLYETPVSNAGLATLARFAHLTVLHLAACPNISDAGLAHLSQLHNLHTLSLAHTAVTGAGLRELGRLPQLKALFVGSELALTQGDLAAIGPDKIERCGVVCVLFL